MANVIVIGAQWGDEGKGKITDLLSKSADVVVRYQGGVNAGHTVVVKDQTFKLHLIPSGILYRETECLIGSGTVIDPRELIAELDKLDGLGVSSKNLFISETAHVTMPYHRLIDQASEERRGTKKIGTTKRGIGPTYADKSERTGIRVCDLMDLSVFREQLEWTISYKNIVLEKLYNLPPLNPEEVYAEYEAYAERLRPHVVDSSLHIYNALQKRKNVLFEGAQGTLLDLDHGTYPYVTSSNPVAGGACIGSGIGPTAVDRVIGVAKAYTTRVGEGPFPTELFDEDGQRLGTRGHEFGTTTGRKRRCGWFDAVLVKQTCATSGVRGISLTKLDVLDGFETLKICVGYELDGEQLDYLPTAADQQARCSPIYEEMPGWSESTEGARSWADLPANAIKYVRRVEELIECPVALLSTSPERDDTILVTDPFAD